MKKNITKSKSIDERLSNIEKLLLSQKTVFNIEEISIYTGISVGYLYKLSARGDLPVSQPNGKMLFAEKAKLDEWLLRNPKKTNAQIDEEASTYVSLKKSGAK
jgi:Zn-dependent peptidase ImmA (M78 family)